MPTVKRGRVKITFDVFSTTEAGLVQEAERVAEELRKQYDNNASVISIITRPFSMKDQIKTIYGEEETYPKK
jgi:hypothetical protein